MSKAQKAELSQESLLVSHRKEASPALLLKRGAKGDVRSPPAEVVQHDWLLLGSCRSPSGDVTAGKAL